MYYYYKYLEYTNSMTEKLMAMARMCAEKRMSFNYTTEGTENFIKINEGSVIINIFDPEDDTLEQKLDEKIEELKQFGN